MGGGSSKDHVYLKRLLDQKEEEIQGLKKDLQRFKDEKLPEISEPTYPKGVQQAVRKSISKKVNNESLSDASARDFSKRKRRLEMSAEVMNNRGLASSYQKVVINKTDLEKKLISNVISENILFADLDDAERKDCIDAFFRLETKRGEIVISQGAHGENFYAIGSGTLEIYVAVGTSPPIKYGELAEGMGFGELALLCNTPRAATIKASTDAILWGIARTTYREICTYHELLRRDKYLKFLRQVPILKNLSKHEFESVAVAMEWENYPKGSTIVRQGEVGEHFYIIEQGEVKVSKVDDDDSIELGILRGGDYFGEMALLKDEVRSATCTATTEVSCLSLAREHFCIMLGSLEELMQRKTKAIVDNATPDESEVPGEVVGKYSMDIAQEDLEIREILGCGAFGRVKLVKHLPTGNSYALKILVKDEVVRNNLEVHVVNERRVMLQLDHPFILKLHNTYKDQRYVYFLVELTLGGEMFTHLKKQGRLSEDTARFYIASVILAFQHMHCRNIAYRDLKPENLMFDLQGFLKVIDFGLAKTVEGRTWTLCGTPDYLAPEIILNKGHDKAVDYWALGILIYELIAGYVPFYAEDPMQVYHLALSGNIHYPKSFGRPVCDLISKLLCQNPSRRLGNLKNGIQDIMKQKWFGGFDWDGLLSKTMSPPYTPKVKNNLDVSNFDKFDEGSKVEPPISPWDPDF